MPKGERGAPRGGNKMDHLFAGTGMDAQDEGADLTMLYVVGGLFIFLYLVVTYILTSSEKERKRMLEKSK
jgi:O-antigen/teichoic acid export membrane protein